MDEAAECDEILLMRDGAILRQTTPDGLRSETGEADLSRAFLALIERVLGVSVRVTWAIGRRVLWQIRRDPRTIALLLVVPVVLLVLLKYVFAGKPSVFATIGVPLCGLFPFIVMFLITSIAMLRERTSGTLERQMTLPMSRLDLLVGYAIAFGLLAAIQAIVVCTVGFLALGLDAAHGAWLVALLAIGNALLGMALGLAVSAFARTEFQAVQFMPALIFPQLILCGLFIERSEMGTALYWASWALPLTYSYDAPRPRPTRPARRLVRARTSSSTLIATIAALALGKRSPYKRRFAAPDAIARTYSLLASSHAQCAAGLAGIAHKHSRLDHVPPRPDGSSKGLERRDRAARAHA